MKIKLTTMNFGNSWFQINAADLIDLIGYEDLAA